MTPSSRLRLVVLAAILGASCASPTEVVQESESQLQQTRPVPRGDGLVERLPLCCAPVGLKLSRAAGFGYVAQASAGQLRQFFSNTRSFGDSVAVGRVPSDIVFSPNGSRAYVSNQWSQNVGIIDVASNKQIDVIPTIGDPFALAISADGKTLLVTTNSNALRKFDIATKAEIGTIPLIATSHHILMDPRGRSLYVATRDGGTVMQVDWRTMTVRRTFRFGGRTQDMAFSPNSQELYIANEASNQLHVLHINSGHTHSIALDGAGEGLALGNGGKFIYVGLVFNGGVQVIDRKTEKTVRVVPVGGVPREIQPALSGAYVIVTNELGWVDLLEPTDSIVPPPPPPPPPPPDTTTSRVAIAGAVGIARFESFAYVSEVRSQKVARLDLTTNTVTAQIPVGDVPCYIVFNSTGTRAYVANQFSDNVGVIDVATNRVIQNIPLTGDPLPVAISTDDKTLFVTTNADRLWKVDLATGTVTGSLALPATSHHLLTHPNGTLLYVATRDGGSVLEVNWRSMSVVRSWAVGSRPQGMAMSADGSELYVANELSNRLHIITLSSGVVANVPLSAGGEGIALGPDGKLYIGEVFAGLVQVVDPRTRTVVRTITVGGTPREVAADPARNRMLVANEDGWVDLIRIQ